MNLELGPQLISALKVPHTAETVTTNNRTVKAEV